MHRRTVWLFALTALVVLVPFRSPAPLTFIPGEGWIYETFGGGKWRRERAKDQLDVAVDSFKKQDYGTSMKAARRVVKVWPHSDYAPAAQYLVGRCYEEKNQDDKAFAAYARILKEYPMSDRVDEVLKRQYAIASRYLAGQYFNFRGVIPLYRSMDKTAKMFSDLVKAAPFSDVGPHAQLRVGAAREKQRKYPEAVAAYETAADRYHDRKPIAADALYRAGVCYHKEANKADYDQSTAGKAISTFNDFLTYYPDDRRAPEVRKRIEMLREEQARGSFEIAKYYEKKNRFAAAKVYYNEAVVGDPGQKYSAPARERLAEINKRIEAAAK